MSTQTVSSCLSIRAMNRVIWCSLTLSYSRIQGIYSDIHCNTTDICFHLYIHFTLIWISFSLYVYPMRADTYPTYHSSEIFSHLSLLFISFPFSTTVLSLNIWISQWKWYIILFLVFLITFCESFIRKVCPIMQSIVSILILQLIWWSTISWLHIKLHIPDSNL